ncbi:hypothetical protein EGN69_03730 [Pseudomonas monteilii]|nr:hypothetical protein EGN69_03730 [Pseudomonas monteilii]
MACTGLFAGKPAPTKATRSPVGAGLPAKRPAQATQGSSAGQDPAAPHHQTIHPHITTIDTPTSGNITPSTSITATAAFQRGRS